MPAQQAAATAAAAAAAAAVAAAAAADRHENYDTISPIKNKKKRAVAPPFARGQRADGLAIVMKTNRSELDRPHARARAPVCTNIKKQKALLSALALEKKREREREEKYARQWPRETIVIYAFASRRESVRIPPPGV